MGREKQDEEENPEQQNKQPPPGRGWPFNSEGTNPGGGGHKFGNRAAAPPDKRKTRFCTDSPQSWGPVGKKIWSGICKERPKVPGTGKTLYIPKGNRNALENGKIR